MRHDKAKPVTSRLWDQQEYSETSHSLTSEAILLFSASQWKVQQSSTPWQWSHSLCSSGRNRRWCWVLRRCLVCWQLVINRFVAIRSSLLRARNEAASSYAVSLAHSGPSWLSRKKRERRKERKERRENEEPRKKAETHQRKRRRRKRIQAATERQNRQRGSKTLRERDEKRLRFTRRLRERKMSGRVKYHEIER